MEGPGDGADNMVVGCNTGPAAAVRFGGIPPYAETQGYVRAIHIAATPMGRQWFPYRLIRAHLVGATDQSGPVLSAGTWRSCQDRAAPLALGVPGSPTKTTQLTYRARAGMGVARPQTCCGQPSSVTAWLQGASCRARAGRGREVVGVA